MSTRYNDGSHYENHQRATELENLPAHMHRTGELHGKQDHLTDTERSRQEHEHTPENTTGHGVEAFGHNDIAALAHKLWVARGCPEGSPDVDWLEAVKELRAHAKKT